MTSARFLARTVDYLGLLLIAGFALMLLLPLQWGGNSYQWNSSVIIGMLCGAVVCLGVFIGWERYMGVRAMIPFHVIGQRVVYCSCIFFASLLASIVFRTFYLPIFFQSVQDDSALMSGVKMLPSIVAQICATMASGVLGTSNAQLTSATATKWQSVLTTISGSSGVLHALRSCKSCFLGRGNGPRFHLQSRYNDR